MWHLPGVLKESLKTRSVTLFFSNNVVSRIPVSTCSLVSASFLNKIFGSLLIEHLVLVIANFYDFFNLNKDKFIPRNYVS